MPWPRVAPEVLSLRHFGACSWWVGQACFVAIACVQAETQEVPGMAGNRLHMAPGEDSGERGEDRDTLYPSGILQPEGQLTKRSYMILLS